MYTSFPLTILFNSDVINIHYRYFIANSRNNTEVSFLSLWIGTKNSEMRKENTHCFTGTYLLLD